MIGCVSSRGEMQTSPAGRQVERKGNIAIRKSGAAENVETRFPLSFSLSLCSEESSVNLAG